jgi:hypothetical protein
MHVQVNESRMKKGGNHRQIDTTVAATDSAPNGHDPSRFMAALNLMAEALLAARARRKDPWHLAASLSEHAELGLTVDDCKELVSRGLIDARNAPDPQMRSHVASGQGESKPGRRASSRRPARQPSRTIGLGTRFILTDAGLAFLMKCSIPARIGSVATEYVLRTTGSSIPTPSVASSRLRPHYDIDLRELSVSREVILRLPVQARNLAAVLTALELSGWKSRVGKPLNGRPDGDDPCHLAGAAYSLNLRQTLIEFHADDGAILWEWRSSTKSPRRDASLGKRKPRPRPPASCIAPTTKRIER